MARSGASCRDRPGSLRRHGMSCWGSLGIEHERESEEPPAEQLVILQFVDRAGDIDPLSAMSFCLRLSSSTRAWLKRFGPSR